MKKFSTGEWWALAAALSYLIQGLTLRAAAPTVDPIFGVAVVAMPTWMVSFIMVISNKKRRSQLSPDTDSFIGFNFLGKLAGAAAISYGVGNILWILALREGGLTITIPAIQSTAVWGAVLGCIILKEKITPQMMSGLGVFCLGLLFLGWGRTAVDIPGEGWKLALVFGVVAALCWSILSVCSRFVMLAGTDRFTVIFVAVTAGLILLNLILWQRGTLNSWWNPPDEFIYLLIAGCCNVLAQVSLTTALSLTEVSSVNVITATGNAISPVFGFIIFLDPLNAVMIAGVVVVLVGAVVVQRGRVLKPAADLQLSGDE